MARRRIRRRRRARAGGVHPGGRLDGARPPASARRIRCGCDLRLAYPGPADVGAALADGASPWRGIRRAIDLAWLFALPLGQLLAAARLRPGAGSVAWRLAVPSAVLAYVQLYPRADFWHLLPVAGLSLVVALGVVLQVLASAGSGGRRVAAVLVSALLVVAAVRWLPNVAVVRAALSPAPPAAPLLDRAAIRWDLASSPALRTVPEVVDAVAGAPRLVGFPALAIFNFLSGIPSPLRHDYSFPGLFTDPEEQAIAAELAACRCSRGGAARAAGLLSRCLRFARGDRRGHRARFPARPTRRSVRGARGGAVSQGLARGATLGLLAVVVERASASPCCWRRRGSSRRRSSASTRISWPASRRCR